VARSRILIPAQIALLGVTVALFRTQWKEPVPEPPEERAFPQKVPEAPVKAVPLTLPLVSSDPAEQPLEASAGEAALAEMLATTQPPKDEPLPLTDPGPPLDLSGDPLNPAAYQITAESVSQFDLKKKNVVFSGNVELQSQRFHLRSNKLTVEMDQGQGKMKSIVANGNVEVDVVDPDPAKTFRGSATVAVYDPVTGVITLSGFPRIVTEGREHRASTPETTMLLFTEDPHLITKGRASTVIQRSALPTQNAKP
jgi:lipopolysaccharide transport protein LptA